MKGSLLDINVCGQFKLTVSGVIPNENSFALRDCPLITNDQVGQKPVFSLSENLTNQQVAKVELISSTINKDDVEIVYGGIKSDGSFLPILFEQQNYHIQLSSQGRHFYTLKHQSKSLLEGMVENPDHKTVSGQLNFRNDVGMTRFSIQNQNRDVLTFSLVVASTKLSFWKGRAVMINEIREVHDEITQRLFKATTQNSESTHRRSSGTEWLTSFSQFSTQLIYDAKLIEQKAHSKLSSQPQLERIIKVRKPDRNYFKRVNRLGKEVVHSERKIWLEKKKNNWDTPENRYIKLLLSSVVKSGNRWIKKANAFLSEDYSKATLEHLRKIQADIIRIEKILKNGFWDAISTSKEKIRNKGNFIFHAEFVRTESIVRAINLGLSFDTEGKKSFFSISMDLLYETWAFLKLAALTSKVSTGDENSFKLKINSNSFNTMLRAGKGSEIKVTPQISLLLNRLYTPSSIPFFTPIVNQKPDIVFQLMNSRSLVLFDAKYKFKVIVTNSDGGFEYLDNSQLVSKDISGTQYKIVPQDTDINTMHRYKDALLRKEESSNTISKASRKGIILYPDNPNDPDMLEEMQQLIHKYEIGALPIAPGVRDPRWLEGVINGQLIPNDAINTEQVRIVGQEIYKLITE